MRPKYLSGHGAPSLDGQCLMVIAAIHYSFQTEDHEFLRTHWDALAKPFPGLKERFWMAQMACSPREPSQIGQTALPAMGACFIQMSFIGRRCRRWLKPLHILS
jgi:hypothetical protein